MSQGVLSKAEVVVEVRNGIGNVPLLVVPMTISISEGVYFVSSPLVEDGGMEKLGV